MNLIPLKDACQAKVDRKIDITWRKLNELGKNVYSDGNCLRNCWRTYNGDVMVDLDYQIKPKTHDEIIQEKKADMIRSDEEKAIKDSIKITAQKDMICEKMLESAKVIKPYRIEKLVMPNTKASSTIPILMLSDIQAGTYISKEATGGLNEYNKNVLIKQFQMLREGIVSISVKQLSETPLLKIHMLGDMVEGLGIFPGQAYNVDQDLYDQMYGLAELISKLLQELLQLFDRIEIKCIGGNHGRVGKKGENPHYINWDVNLYKYLERSLQNFPQITWDIPKSWWILDETHKTKSLLIHGDGIKGWNGIPFYGIQRADARYTKLLAAMGGRYDMMEIGHFHTPAEIPTPTGAIIVNGCFPGASMYALKDLNTSNRPEQKMFGIHKKHGKTWSFPIYLDY